jgi:hypothetical protein
MTKTIDHYDRLMELFGKDREKCLVDESSKDTPKKKARTEPPKQQRLQRTPPLNGHGLTIAESSNKLPQKRECSNKLPQKRECSNKLPQKGENSDKLPQKKESSDKMADKSEVSSINLLIFNEAQVYLSSSHWLTKEVALVILIC